MLKATTKQKINGATQVQDSLLEKLKDPNRLTEEITHIIRAVVSRMVSMRNLQRRGIEPEDLIQEVLIRLFKEDARILKTYDPERAKFTTWLTIVTRSTVISAQRRKQLDTVRLAPDHHALPETQTPEVEPLVFPENLLSPQQSLILTLLFEREESPEEASQILGITVQTVRSAKHKALSKLRNFYKNNHPGDE